MNHLRVAFAPYWQSIQHALFPQLERVLGPLTEKQQQLVQTLEVIRIEQMIPRRFRVPGRPPKDRAAMARALVAKAVYDMPTTRVLLDRLDTDVVLRRICGWERRSEVPSESVFSRAFAEFSDTQLPQRVHEALIWNTHRDRLVGHLSRDSTAIEAREKPAAKEKAPPPPKRKRGRLKKGEERPKVLKRLDRQATMSLPAMLDDLPTACDVGMKKDSKGYKSTWVGYKLHIDVADGQIPISCLLTSASLHDSQAAIPLATLSAGRTTNLYDLMDAAYDAEPIRQHSRSLSHVPLIDTNPRRDKTLAEELRRVRLFFVGGPRGFCQRHGKSYLTRRRCGGEGGGGRLADRPRYSISVSLGVVPLVLPRRGSPSTHRSRGWLRSTRSFRTASAPTQFATRRIRARAWMKQRYWVAPACTSELHHGRGPGTARPFDDAGGDGTQAPPCRRTRPRG